MPIYSMMSAISELATFKDFVASTGYEKAFTDMMDNVTVFAPTKRVCP